MKLYDVNERIAELMVAMQPDMETGELPENYDEMKAELDAMHLEHDRIVEYLAKTVLNGRADIAAMKEEETRLKELRQSLEKRNERLMNILGYECGGKKTDLGIAVISYRKSEAVNIADADAVIRWAQDNAHEEVLKYKDPEISKTDIKALIKDGIEVPGAYVEQKMNCSLK